MTNVEITGSIKDYIKVIDGDYKIIHSNPGAFIIFKFEIINYKSKKL